MVINTGILRSVHAEEYGFSLSDMVVATMIKAYLQQIAEEDAVEQLGRVVSPAVKELHGGTVRRRGLEKEVWEGINKEELSVLIECARKAAVSAAQHWKPQKKEYLLRKTLSYMREDFFPRLSAEAYVDSLPERMTEFLTDCWLALKIEGVVTDVPSLTPIEDMGFPTRYAHSLKRSGFEIAEDLLSIKSREELLLYRYIGEEACEEIVKRLEALGLDASHLK